MVAVAAVVYVVLVVVSGFLGDKGWWKLELVLSGLVLAVAEYTVFVTGHTLRAPLIVVLLPLVMWLAFAALHESEEDKKTKADLKRQEAERNAKHQAWLDRSPYGRY